MKRNPGPQYEISIDGVPRTYREQKDIALQSAQFLKAVFKLKDFETGEESVVALKAGSD